MEVPDEHDSFRDRSATIDEQGKRKWVFAYKPRGRFYSARTALSYVYLLVFFGLPFLKYKGEPFLLLNIMERKFVVFGFVFWSQDFYLFGITMILFVVFIIVFTVAFGRLFCGWACPQTVFMEMVFRRIEYWIDGDRGAQIRLQKQEWNAEKIRKRVTKWIVFFIISFIIANVFLAYLVSSDRLLLMIKEGPALHTSTLIALLIFTGVFYFVFAWFREQVCIIACPYGRMQGVLLDNKSINVAYDHVRGEKELGRAKFNKQEDRATTGKGDCIDCKLCVHVCPTGIDIRNGTQLECINCTACIDECDSIMESVGLPKGLIRYASEDEIVKKEKFVFTTRMKGYSAVLIILIGILLGMLFLRNDVEATILRLPGQLFEHKGENISNVYTYKIVNKTTKEFEQVTFKLIDPKGEIILVGKPEIRVKPDGIAKGTLFIEINPAYLEGDKIKLKIEVYDGDVLIETTTTNFMGPRSFN